MKEATSFGEDGSSLGRKPIFVHVGLEKTGTTALQSMLHLQRGRLASEAGITVSRDGEYTTGLHHRFASSFIPPTVAAHHVRMTDADIETVLARLDAAPGNRIVLSSELFSYSPDQQIARLAKLLEGRDVKIIVGLRRQDQYFSSQYLQSLKGVWQLGRRPIPLEKFRTHNMDYDAFVAKWEAVFGTNAVRVMVFNDPEYPSIYDHFLSLVTDGRHVFGSIERPTHVINPGLSAIHRKIIAEDIALIEDPSTRVALETRVIRNSDTYMKSIDPRQSHAFLEPAVAEAIMAEHAAGNRILAQRKLGREDLFVDAGSDKATRPMSIDDFREVYIRMLAEAEQDRYPRLLKTSSKIGPPFIFIGGTGSSGMNALLEILGKVPRCASYGNIEIKLLSASGGLVDLKAAFVTAYNHGRATTALSRLDGIWEKMRDGQGFGMQAMSAFAPASKLDAAYESLRKSLTRNGIPFPQSEQAFLDKVARFIGDLALLRATPQTQYFVEKTPHNLLDIGFLEGIVPGSKYVHILSDPIATALSIANQKTWGPSDPEGALQYVENYLDRWEGVQRDVVTRNGIHVLEITLEDILLDRQKIADMLSRYLSLDISVALAGAFGNLQVAGQIEQVEGLADVRSKLAKLASDRTRRLSEAAVEKLYRAAALET